jgi:predicted DNA-binding protein
MSPTPEPETRDRSRKEQAVTTSLRMYPSSQERLKLLAVQLRTTMTALLEEALNAKWEEWEARQNGRTRR